MTLPEAQRVTGKAGEFDEIAVQAEDGVSAEELRDSINAVLPDTAEAKTGEQIAEDDSSEIKDGFGFLTTALLIFAGITIFVGAFLIFNIFSITVAQRTREFGALRTLGASSRQVLTTVIGEALVIGLLASIVGVIAGAGFVKLLLAVFKAVGFELPQSGLPIEPRDGDRRDRRRHAGDARLGAHPGPPRDPGQPARGAPRGRRRRSRDRQSQAHRGGRDRGRPRHR